MNIGFVGAGRVGCTLGKYLASYDIAIEGYYSKTKESADIAATFVNTKAFESIEDLVKASDIIFLTVSDDAIENVWKCICKYDLSDKLISHFSGSLSSEIFVGIEKKGAYGCSIHPMYAFSDKFTAYREFNTACLTMEGQTKALQNMKKLFGDKLGHRIFTLNSNDKVKYHVAAAFASNYVVAAIQTAVDLMAECGFSDKDTLELLAPVTRGNVNSVLEKGAYEALTGPIERNDVGTVRKHLAAIRGTETEEIYRVLGKKLINIAKIKNPNKDYTVLENIIENNC